MALASNANLLAYSIEPSMQHQPACGGFSQIATRRHYCNVEGGSATKEANRDAV